jgi:quinoprotein glucose dehydrogenase
MLNTRHLKRYLIIPASVGLLAGGAVSAAEQGTVNGEWPTFGGDLSNTRYAPLSQINAENFSELRVAWRFNANSFGPRPETRYQTTPLMVDGVVYATAGSRRAVVALDAGTGEILWMHREDEGQRGAEAPRALSGRGLAFSRDGGKNRVIYVTPGYRMLALDAATGIPDPDFGDHGVVDLKLDADQDMDLVTGEIGLHATPIIADGVILVGAAHLTGSRPESRRNEKGYIRGFDATSGKRLWTYHTIPLRGEFGYDSWGEGSAEYTGNTGAWTNMAVDPELGLAYLPIEQPTGDYYGGHRPGDGLFGESIVAVDLKTGERRWHFQLVHHGIWDFDIPTPPVLADITVDGRPIKALIQPTKQAWLYVFNRETGEPVWPIEERPVEQSDVPLEQTSPTQPFVTWPPAYDRQGVSLDDLIDFTPALKAEAVELVKNFKIGPLFTPPVVSQWPRPLATLMMPSTIGGANWAGGAFDPETKLFFIPSSTVVSPLGLVPPREGQSDMAYFRGMATDPALGDKDDDGRLEPMVQGLPLIKPPYGRITAYDMNTGNIVWQVANGSTPDAIKNHPALAGLDIPPTGRVTRGGIFVTPTLAIAGEWGDDGSRFPYESTTPQGPGAMLRAYDKASGEVVGEVYMPAPQTGAPMTYMHDGRQFIVVPIGAGGFGSELIAYALPRRR